MCTDMIPLAPAIYMLKCIYMAGAKGIISVHITVKLIRWQNSTQLNSFDTLAGSNRLNLLLSIIIGYRPISAISIDRLSSLS